MKSEEKISGGVRKYTKFSVWHNIKRFFISLRLKKIGNEVYIGSNVQFQRHPESIELGERVIIKEGARLCPTNEDASISIGNWTTIGAHTFIYATLSINIGSNCLIAPFCYFVDSNHGIQPEHLIREQQNIASPIEVGDVVWIGVGVVITKGVKIGSGAVIGANSVVTSDIPQFAIAAGVPARIMGYR